MARSEYRRWTPRRPLRPGVQAAIASEDNHTVAPPSSRPGESWLSSAWVYDHDPRKRNAFVRPVVPASTPDRYVRRSLASWYGDAFDGKPTASGEPFDSNGA